MSLVEPDLLPRGRITRRTFWLPGILGLIFISLVARQLDLLLAASGNLSGLVDTVLLWPDDPAQALA